MSQKLSPKQMPTEPNVVETQEEFRAFYEALGSYHSRLLEASSGYNQIVVLGGYAGFFTIWAAISSDLPRWMVLLTGGLIVASLIIYVGWTVASMVILRSHMQRMMNEIAEGLEGFLERAQAAETKSITTSNKLMRFWKPVLWAAGFARSSWIRLARWRRVLGRIERPINGGTVA